MHSAIIFDCDGTLIDSMPGHYVAWSEVMATFEITFDEDRFYRLGGMPSDKICVLLASEQGKTIDPVNAARLKEEAFLRRLHLLEPITPVIEVARGVKKMAGASGGFRKIISLQLQHLQIEDWFDTIVCAEDTTRHKPEPDVFLEAARRMDVAPETCLVYEDSDLGIEAAKRAGMAWVDVRDFHVPKRIT
jgi:HAD superfamily hydrolase (TIGR01509 family)